MTNLILDLCCWGLLPGPWQWLLMAVVLTLLYGRSDWFRRGLVRVVRPWKAGPAGKQRSRTTRWLADRWFLLFAACATAAVAAWVVTWMNVVHRPLDR